MSLNSSSALATLDALMGAKSATVSQPPATYEGARAKITDPGELARFDQIDTYLSSLGLTDSEKLEVMVTAGTLKMGVFVGLGRIANKLPDIQRFSTREIGNAVIVTLAVGAGITSLPGQQKDPAIVSKN